MQNSAQLKLGSNGQIGTSLSPILKWAGGKDQELKYILPNAPGLIRNYYEPFVGGGAVYTAIKAERYFINDRSDELISLYRNLQGEGRDELFSALRDIVQHWGMMTELVERNSPLFIELYKFSAAPSVSQETLIDPMADFIHTYIDEFNGMFAKTFDFNTANFEKELQTNASRKMKRMAELEQEKGKLSESDVLDNIECAFKSAFYMQFRHIYNHAEMLNISGPVKSAVFLFIRNFAYSGMFRYNLNGHLNVPYGGIGYNRKNFRKKIDYLESEELHALLKRTDIQGLDFEEFMENYAPNRNDFVFLDPPYDSEFSTYARNEFTRPDHVRLANYLISRCPAKWMLVIKKTPLIEHLYSEKSLHIRPFNKMYLVSFMNRNDKSAEHLLISNY
jgi:DNA adenine methylase